MEQYLLHLLLEVPDPRLPAVLFDEHVQSLGGDGGLFLSQATLSPQLGHQVPLEEKTDTVSHTGNILCNVICKVFILIECLTKVT